MTITKVVLILVMVFGFTTSEALAQHSEHGAMPGTPPDQLGEVNFPVTCSAASQKDFNRAMALFHSFWFEPAKESFGRALDRDRECGMANWELPLCRWVIRSPGRPMPTR